MRNLFLAIFLAVSIVAFAQEKPQPPIPLELMFGNNRVATTMSVNKSIAGKWRYNNITSLAADYKNTRTETELVVVNSFVYQFHRNFGASGGLQYHFLKGLVPNVVGMGAKDAVYLLESVGLQTSLNGMGRVSSQSISPGSRVSKGQTVSLTLK